jgi:hypothetical protein
LTVTYHAGRRIQATSTDFGDNGAGIPAISGGWKELGRTTLSGSATSVDVTGLADKRYYMVLYNMIDDGTNTQFVTNQFGNGSFDTGSNYAERGSSNGADFTYTGTAYWNTSGGDQVCPELTVQYIANKSDKEKLGISHSCGAQADGAGTAPNRREHTGKWANTSNVIDRIRATTAYGSRTYGTGSEVVVLGYDPDDTHTTNFWEQLADVTLSSTGDNLSSGTITAKKYLWIQTYISDTGGQDSVNMTFNNDTGNNYAFRRNNNGGTDATTAPSSHITLNSSEVTEDLFSNIFIINNSSNEKLVIGHTIQNQTLGAGTAPIRKEFVGKWVPTTNQQITEIDFDNDSSGSYDTNSFIKVWGSN